MKIVWICPEERGGVRSYSNQLLGAIRKVAPDIAIDLVINFQQLEKIENADLVHYQHEYGMFGSKVPFFSNLGQWRKRVHSKFGNVCEVATLHTVITDQWSYPTTGRGWQIPLRVLANKILKKPLIYFWNEIAFSGMRGIIAHGADQVKFLRRRHKGLTVVEIPIFVPESKAKWKFKGKFNTLTVFGFFSPEKGQHVAIRSLNYLKTDVRLVLAGGVRRTEDQSYFDMCKDLAAPFGDRVQVLGFVPTEKMDDVFLNTDLVIVPFVETAGSLSIVDAVSRSCPILASDLPLNKEINIRAKDTIALFESENSKDLAEKVTNLAENPESLMQLSKNSEKYAENFSLESTAKRYLKFYSELLAGQKH